MSLIFKTQLKQLYNTATKTALQSGRSSLILDSIQKSIKGLQLGQPLLKPLEVRSTDIIDVDKLRSYILQLAFDTATIESCAESLEAKLDFIDQQVWTGSQIATNMLKQLEDAISTENTRKIFNAQWSIHDNFTNNSTLLDPNLSTVAVEYSEGLVFLAPSSKHKQVSPKELSLSFTSNNKASLLDKSILSDIINNQTNNSFRSTVNSEGSYLEFDVTFNLPLQISYLTLELVGNPAQVTITDLSSNKQLTNKITSSKSSFFLGLTSETKALRISLKPIQNDYPQVLGIRDLTLWAGGFVEEGLLQLTEVEPDISYSSIYVEADMKIPESTSIIFRLKRGDAEYFSIEPNSWLHLEEISGRAETLNFTNLTEYGALYRIDISENPRSLSGKLSIGLNQFELQVYRNNQTYVGDILGLPEYSSSSNLLSTAWISEYTDVSFAGASGDEFPFQLIETGDNPHPDLVAGYSPLGRQDLGDEVSGLTFLLQNGGASSPLRPGFRYEFKTIITCENSVAFNDAKYWFVQGFNPADEDSFQKKGLSFGRFSMFINATRVAGGSIGSTLYSDGTMEPGADVGINYPFILSEGDNEIKIVIEIPEFSEVTHPGFNDSWRYCQLVLYPNFFDSTFKLRNNISQVLSSGSTSPKSDLDLLYNRARDFRNWGWKTAGEETFLLFNTNLVRSPDQNIGFLEPDLLLPNTIISYEGIPNQFSDNLTVQASLYTSNNFSTPTISKVGVILK